jgi:hypothetical protein
MDTSYSQTTMPSSFLSFPHPTTIPVSCSITFPPCTRTMVVVIKHKLKHGKMTV